MGEGHITELNSLFPTVGSQTEGLPMIVLSSVFLRRPRLFSAMGA